MMFSDWLEMILVTLAVVLTVYSLNGGFFDHGGKYD